MEDFILYENSWAFNNLTTYKGRRKGTINYVAVHCADKNRKPEITNMVRLIHDIKHENIVRFVEWYETTNHLWLIVELCTTGSLEKLLKEDEKLPDNCIKKFGSDLLNGLHYLHSIGILFIDFSPSKIFVSGTGTLKYSHFGVSRLENEDLDNILENYANSYDILEETVNITELIYQDQPNKFKNSGSPFYLAPEVLQGKHYSRSSDMWGLGCLLYQLSTGSPPFIADSFRDLCNKIINMDYPALSNKTSPQFSDVIANLLKKDPLDRISTDQLLKHSFFSNNLLKIESPVLFEEIKKSVRESIQNFDSMRKSVQQTNTSKTYRKEDEPRANFSLSMRSHSVVFDEIDTKIQRKKKILANINDIVEDVDTLEIIRQLMMQLDEEVLHSMVDQSKRLSSFKFDSKALSVTPMTSDRICNLNSAEQSKHLLHINEGLGASERGPPSQKMLNLLNYVGTLTGNAQIVSLLIKSGVLSVLVKQIKDSQQIEYKIKLCTVLTYLLSNANNYNNTSSLEEMLNLLTMVFNEHFKNSKFRLAILCCIGEIIRLHLKQNQKDNDLKIPDTFYTLLMKVLSQKEDISILLCISRITFNMISHSKRYMKKFVSIKIVEELILIYDTSNNETLKCLIFQIISLLGQNQAENISAIMTEFRLEKIIKSLPQVSTKMQQSLLLVLFVLIDKYDKEDVCISAVKLLDSPSTTVRCKVYLLYAAILYKSPNVLMVADNRLFQYIDRDLNPHKQSVVKNSDILMKCLEVVETNIKNAVVINIGDLKNIICTLQKGTQDKVNKLNDSILKLNILKNIMESLIISQKIFDLEFVKCLQPILEYILKFVSKTHNIDQEVFNKLISLTFAVINMLPNYIHLIGNDAPQIIIDFILLPHIKIVAEASGNVRAMALNSFCELCKALLKNQIPPKYLKQFHKLITDNLFTNYEQLLLEPDPLPAHALKLLLLLIESDGSFIKVVEESLIPVVFQVLVDHQASSTGITMGFVIRILNLLISSKSCDLNILYENDLIEHLKFLIFGISSVAMKSFNNGVMVDDDAIVEMLLTLLDSLHIILKMVSDAVRKAIEYQKSGNQLTEEATKNAEHLLTANKPFKQLISILTLLLSNRDVDIAEASLKCLAILIQFYCSEFVGAFTPECMASYRACLIRSDPKKQKIILRLIKRLISTENHHIMALRANGQEFLLEISNMYKDPSNQSDALLLEVISDIFRILDT